MPESMGITIPLEGLPLQLQASIAAELVEMGYTELWSAEGMGSDGFIPLAVAATAAPAVRLGVAIAPVFTRGPALLAQTAATMAATAPGRFVLGIGTSSNVIVQNWNDIPFQQPYQRTRDTLDFLQHALAGDRIDHEYETFSVRGFRLGVTPDVAPPILVAALRPGMLRLAGAKADGAIINWLSATDVATVAPFVHEGGPGKKIVARIMVIPSEDLDSVRKVGRRMIASYLNVPVYRAFHEWLGRGELQPMWDLWDASERAEAAAAIPDHVIDELIVHGSPAQCREHIAGYVANGVTTPVLAIIPVGTDSLTAARAVLTG